MNTLNNYEFTADWFSQNIPTWRQVLGDQIGKINKVLEIGSFEGRSTAWIIEKNLDKSGSELTAIDTWKGGIEHDPRIMSDVELRFDKNVSIALERAGGKVRFSKLKGPSIEMLARLISEGHGGSFDFVYIDGSHQAFHVLEDLVLSFRLCKKGGILACDDYTLFFGRDILNCPKIGIDSFVNCNAGRLSPILAWLYQVYFRKIAD
jgi:hypothetical protein